MQVLQEARGKDARGIGNWNQNFQEQYIFLIA